MNNLSYKLLKELMEAGFPLIESRDEELRVMTGKTIVSTLIRIDNKDYYEPLLEDVIDECMDFYYENFVEGMPAVYFMLDGGFVEKSRGWTASLGQRSVDWGERREDELFGAGETKIEAVINLYIKLKKQ